MFKSGEKMPKKEVINQGSVRRSKLPHSVGVRFGDLIVVAGQTPHDPVTDAVLGDFREQTRAALESIKVVLEGAGTSMDNVLYANCYLVNREDFAAFNEEYVKYFPTNQPVRTTIQVPLMVPELLVEIRVTACFPD